jgi:hypothetical protein
LTVSQHKEKFKNSKFMLLNRKQQAKVAPITSIIMRELNDLYLDEIEAIMEAIESTFKESSQYRVVHVPERDKD